MNLVKLKDKNGKRKTCLILDSGQKGEYTVCSVAFDSCLEYEEHEWTDEKPAKKVTCRDCIETIKWYKSIDL